MGCALWFISIQLVCFPVYEGLFTQPVTGITAVLARHIHAMFLGHIPETDIMLGSESHDLPS